MDPVQAAKKLIDSLMDEEIELSEAYENEEENDEEENDEGEENNNSPAPKQAQSQNGAASSN